MVLSRFNCGEGCFGWTKYIASPTHPVLARVYKGSSLPLTPGQQPRHTLLFSYFPIAALPMIMTSTRDIDVERQRYAQELAEYTRRQWDVARRSAELSDAQPKDKPMQNGSRTPGRRDSQSSSSRGSQGALYSSMKASRIVDEVPGIQSHDYAHRSHRRGGGIAHENRVVAAQ